MNTRLLIAFAALAFTGTAVLHAQTEERFSKAMAQVEVTATGVGRLNSDQVAILDALVRRDVAASRYVSKKPRAARFSERLSADERHNAGLDSLSPTELAALDAAVERLIAPPATATYAVGGSAVTAPTQGVKIRRGPEIHGSVELMVGAGSHGYSEYGGAMTVSLEDPASHFAIAVGYAELHTKGGYYLRDCRGGFGSWAYDPLRQPGVGY